MAKPTTRQQLIDYCFRKLGAPVLEINVDDDQVDDLVDDAIQLFNERHFDGVERMYLKYEITQGDIDRGIGAKIAGETVEDGQLVLLDGGSEIDISTESGAEFLLLAGPEINEPIARYGPFVMNTRQEIHQAIIDYQNGTLA